MSQRAFGQVCRFFLTLTSIGLSLFAAGCPRSGSVPVPQDRLTVQLTAEPVSLNPTLAEDGVSLRVLANTMDGLVGYDNAGHLQLRLAERYSRSPDGRHYDFILRPSAAWSDGRAVEPEDFVRGIRRALAPGTTSKLSTLLYPIEGARAYREGKIKANRLGVRAEGRHVLIDLERPVGYWADVMSLPVAFPVRDGTWTESGPVTGPYRIVEHRPDQLIRLGKNERYWGYSAESPKEVLLQIVQDETTGVSLFERGTLDILTRVPPLEIPRLSKRFTVLTTPFLATYFLSFNTRKGPFRDREVRRAIAGSIRREELVASLGSGEPPARSWIPVGLDGYLPYSDPMPVFRDSVERVRSRSDLKRTPIIAGFDSGSRNSMIMEKVQHDVLENLGIRLALSHQDWKAHVKSISSDPPALFRFGWMAPFEDPISHLQAFTSSDPNNYTGWSNRKYDRLVSEIEALSKGPDRNRKILEAQRLLVEEEAIAVPLFHYTLISAFCSRVQKFAVNAFGGTRFDEIRLVSPSGNLNH